ncbi:MAG: sugar phosphate nucleotidyltransferase [bacterium]|nr:sugar phosphate nucleotidyltransferase [bacterium]
MKGIIYARNPNRSLDPLTRVLPSSLLPNYDEPLICRAMDTMATAGVKEIIFVVGKAEIRKFPAVIEEMGKTGRWPERTFRYLLGDDDGGLLNALLRAKEYCRDESVIVVPGNIYLEADISVAKGFEKGALVFLKRAEAAERILLSPRGIEQPAPTQIRSLPVLETIIEGLGVFDASVFARVEKLDSKELPFLPLLRSYFPEERLFSAGPLNGYCLEIESYRSLFEAAELHARTLRAFSPELLCQGSETPYRKSQIAIYPHLDNAGLSGTGVRGRGKET